MYGNVCVCICVRGVWGCVSSGMGVCLCFVASHWALLHIFTVMCIIKLNLFPVRCGTGKLKCHRFLTTFCNI